MIFEFCLMLLLFLLLSFCCYTRTTRTHTHRERVRQRDRGSRHIFLLQNVIFGRRCAKHVIDKSGELRLMKKKMLKMTTSTLCKILQHQIEFTFSKIFGKHIASYGTNGTISKTMRISFVIKFYGPKKEVRHIPFGAC